MKKHLKAAEILKLIEPTDVNTRFILREQAPIKEMILALEKTQSIKARYLLCTVLGDRHAKSAVPILLQHLNDPDLNVRIYAAEALGKIGDQKAGQVLLDLLYKEQPRALRSTLAVVMGPICYRPAVPRLTQALTDEDSDVRGCAAWSLGMLLASESIPALEHAASIEKVDWAKNHMIDALIKMGVSS